MALENISGGLQGLLGGLKTGVDLQNTTADEERKRRLAMLQALLHSQQLLEENPEAGEGLKDIIPEASLSRMQDYARKSKAAEGAFISQATGGRVAPDIASQLSKRQGPLIAQFAKHAMDREEESRIGSYVNLMHGAIDEEIKVNPQLTRGEAAIRAIHRLPEAARPIIGAITKEKGLGFWGPQMSVEQEKQSQFGQILQYTMEAVNSGAMTEENAAKLVISIAPRHFQKIPSPTEIMQAFPTAGKAFFQNEAIARAYGTGVGQAGALQAPVAPIAPGGPKRTVGDLLATQAGKEAGARAQATEDVTDKFGGSLTVPEINEIISRVNQGGFAILKGGRVYGPEDAESLTERSQVKLRVPQFVNVDGEQVPVLYVPKRSIADVDEKMVILKGREILKRIRSAGRVVTGADPSSLPGKLKYRVEPVTSELLQRLETEFARKGYTRQVR